MDLATATRITQSALSTLSTESSVVSRNIAGVNNNGTYSRKITNVVTALGGGVAVMSITRAQNGALFDTVLGATSSSATQRVITDGLTTLQRTVGDTTSATSLAAQISNLTNILQQYQATPNDSSLAASVVTTASSLANTLHNATTTVQQLRVQTDAQMASSVSTINSLLSQFQTVNSQVVSGTALGADVTDLLDKRDSILTQLSQQIGISTTTNPNNAMSIYTDSGATLFQGGVARSVTFQATNAYVPGSVGNAVYVDGVAVTGSAASMPIQSGALAGLANLRDNITVTYQAQLDATAGGLINAFSETDPGGSGTILAGLFTNAGSSVVPSSAADTGLAGSIVVNAAVDPTQGGNASLLRDGINFNFNTTNDAAYSGQLQQLLTNLAANQSFNAAGGILGSNSVSDYATASINWLEVQRQSASSESAYQSTLLSNSTSALSSATGVSLDTEMSRMLDLEQAYAATAKLLSTISSMFSDLISAINVPVA